MRQRENPKSVSENRTAQSFQFWDFEVSWFDGSVQFLENLHQTFLSAKNIIC